MAINANINQPTTMSSWEKQAISAILKINNAKKDNKRKYDIA